MKKIFIFLILSIAVVSCYKDFIKDFVYSSVYFAYQTDVRTFVVGEGMKINIGVDLGGVRDNTISRNVGFSVDNSFITPAILAAMKVSQAYIVNAVSGVTTLLPLPTNYYTLSDNSNMVIQPGQVMGSVTMKADSTNFLADAKTIIANYAISLNITSADADSIVKAKRYTVIGLKYENMLFGNYYHGGVTTVKNASGTVVNTLTYRTTIPVPDAQIWVATTVAPDALTINGYSNQTTSKAQMKITLSGGTVTVNSVAGATNVILPDGNSTFNQSKLLQNRKIFLSYKYANADGTTSFAQDTLTFRNRVRDGVNEWQDENPSHY